MFLQATVRELTIKALDLKKSITRQDQDLVNWVVRAVGLIFDHTTAYMH